MFFKVMSVFLSMAVENLVTQSPHNSRYENMYSLGFGVLPKTKLNYVADMVLDRKDTPYL